MKRIILMLCWLTPVVASAQINKGVRFQNLGNWAQVLERAKQEHKNIFIDAYTTWCGPCKKMDAEVYSDVEVGEFVNANFIAVKIQMDDTGKDSDYARKWFPDAKYLMNKYHIDAFPTCLFISPDGELLQKDVGYQVPKDFLAILKNAIDTEKSYAGQIRMFKAGKLINQELFSLALKAKENHQDTLAMEMAKEYKKMFIDKSTPVKIIDDRLPHFISEFIDLFSTNDEIIQFMYHKPFLADSMMKIKGFARRVSDYIIDRGIISPEIRKDGKYVTILPAWSEIEEKISKKFDPKTAKRLIINSKVGWYGHIKDWDNIIKYKVEQLDNEGLDTVGLASMGLNNLCYNVMFLHTNDPYALNKAIGYMEVILKNNPQSHAWLDTYANLLYKVGRKQEAIKQELIAIKEGTRAKDENLSLYQDVLRKMQENLPTW